MKTLDQMRDALDADEMAAIERQVAHAVALEREQVAVFAERVANQIAWVEPLSPSVHALRSLARNLRNGDHWKDGA